jgi:phage terminase large subunit-like protein
VSQWKDDRLALLEQQARAKRENRMLSFAPYPKQIGFFEMGAVKRERLLMAGNQVGKSEAAAFELACHLTGTYPKWWEGKRWEHSVRGWSAGESRDATRDILQRKLCGPANNEELFGTGMIPKKLFVGKPTLSHGAAGAFDMFQVRHKSGGISELSFKTYEQEVTKWQGSTLDFISFDEEPPKEHYSEGVARLTGDGMVFLTFTPLEGYSTVVSRFLRDDSPEARRDRGVIRMTLAEAEHFTPEEKERRLAGYPAHEREARANGVPMLGSGAVFESVIESDISTKLALSEVPAHWPKLWALDFGISHPFAAVLIAWDRDADCIYILHTIKMSGGIPVNHAAAMNAVGRGIPVAYPHDGDARDKGSGVALAQIYKAQGLNMLGSHATHASGGYSTEAGITEMLERMRDGRFKVASHLADWWDEFRGYHRKDGLIIKVNDDLMSASRIGVMARRHAKPGLIGSRVSPAWRNDPTRPRMTGDQAFWTAFHGRG